VREKEEHAHAVLENIGARPVALPQPAARRLHLDHVGAEIGEELYTGRPEQELRERQDADAGENRQRRPSIHLHVHALEDVRGRRHEAAAIGRHGHAREDLALRLVALGHFVRHGDRVAEEQRRREAHAIVAVRDPRALDALEDFRRRVGHEPDGERAVGDAPAVARLAHVRLVGVIRREVAGDPGEEIDVGLRHRLADGDLAAEGQRGEGIVCHGRDGSGKVPAPARGGPAMADTIRVVEYFYVETPNTPGVGAAMLSTLRDAGVNLLAFSGFPSGRRAQIDFVPEDAAAFRAAAKAAKWKLVGPKKAFLVSGADRPGAVAELMTKLAQAKINVTAVDALCATGGSFGAIVWVEQRDVVKAAKALGAA